MIKLKPGQTLGQFTGFDKSPHINNFVQKDYLIAPKTQKVSTSVIRFGK